MKDIYLTLLILTCALVVNRSAMAGPIIDGKEWLQPRLTLGYTWSDFDTVCGEGICTGSISSGDVQGPDLRGWTWASAEEVGDMFRITTPHPGGIASYSSSSFNVVDNFIDATGFLLTEEIDLGAFLNLKIVSGFTSTLDPTNSFAYGGAVASGIVPLSGPLFLNGSRVSTRFETELSSRPGGWLYRSAVSMPSISTLLLLGPALLCLIGFRRRSA